MDKDLKIEFEKISKQFQSLNTRFDGVDKRFEKSDQQVKSIKDFLYKEMPTKQEMEERFSELPTKQNFSNLQTSVDSYAKKADLYYQEMAVMRHRMERMEDWIKLAAPKLGVEYKV